MYLCSKGVIKMAYVFHNRNENEDKYKDLMNQANKVRNVGVGMIIGLIAFSIFVPVSKLWLFVEGVSIVVMIYLMYKHGNLMSESNILESGVSGENEVFDTLKYLPEEYVVATNVPISCNGNRSEVDALVMSPYGMYVVEVKNHKGVIEGNVDDRVWRQYKNNGFDKTMRNPIRQMHNQKRILFGINKSKQLFVPINGLVVFPSALEVNVEMNEVLNGVEKLNSIVMEKNRVRVSCNELRRVIKAYGIDVGEVRQMIHDFYRTNCPELLECTG